MIFGCAAGLVAFENRVAPLVQANHTLITVLRSIECLLTGAWIVDGRICTAGEFKLEVAWIVITPRYGAAGARDDTAVVHFQRARRAYATHYTGNFWIRHELFLCWLVGRT
ncbi:hypothetical protein XVE_1409 [Xanthomonas vesicatoria ATCC 35937]|uniref:Uncharacterized protein n=1 Tax=Xanthomonas vesicatoria ATCC 35937 TaxID=925775 RepID=F0BBD9_9XANT|nr:hypothetical protein XVE_1409 [Xanthomonas vesicatoria ATCC 35937]